MNLEERQQRFLDAAKAHFGATKSTRVSKLFGVSNSAKVVEGGIQLGVANLDATKDNTDAFLIATVMRFPPEDEVYVAVLVRKDKERLLSRLASMKQASSKTKAVSDLFGEEEEEEEEGSELDDIEVSGNDSTLTAPGKALKYSHRNNLVPIYLGTDGLLWMRNSGFWNSLTFNKGSIGPSVEPDEIFVAVYPPAASARRSLLAREFIGWLGKLAGHEKVQQHSVWSSSEGLSRLMRRMPTTFSISELESRVEELGGYYPTKEVRRLHAALNFLPHKRFVILSGISGTGKTQLALKYARAVHGISEMESRDPFIFECPVRPEWTDPSGLTGYHDALTNKYNVPPFLEAILVAAAHGESPVFVILDELNIAKVEYYLADFLATIETRGMLHLHSNSVPLEGSTGGSINAEIKIPKNLFVIGTINVDETTNPLSDKVLDRASIIEMSSVDARGFITRLVQQHSTLAKVSTQEIDRLISTHSLMADYGLSFGYRVLEECLHYHAFDIEELRTPPTEVSDQLFIQKILTKLRGSERQRPLLESLLVVCQDLPKSTTLVCRLIDDLNEFGAFQSMR